MLISLSPGGAAELLTASPLRHVLLFKHLLGIEFEVMPLQQRYELAFERHLLMMCFLPLNVFSHDLHLRVADRKFSIPHLPFELTVGSVAIIEPLGRDGLDVSYAS